MQSSRHAPPRARGSGTLAHRVARPSLGSTPRLSIQSSIIGTVIALSIFAPEIERLAGLSPRLVLAACMALVIADTSGRSRNTVGRAFATVGIAAAALVALLALDRLWSGSLDPKGVANAERYLLLLPLATYAGRSIGRSGRFHRYARPYVLVAGLITPLALYEVLSGRSLLGRDYLYFVENGQGRALLAADHPLVLGILFASAIPMVHCVRLKHPKLMALWIFAGVLATNSEGPSAVGSVCLALILFPRLLDIVPRLWRWIGALLAGLGLATAYLSLAAWSQYVPGLTSTEYSRNYRSGLYSIAPKILADTPLGYGFNGLPDGTWWLLSAYKGLRDVGTSIDSEPIYLITIAGYIGLGAYIVAVIISLRALRSGSVSGVCSLAVTLSGLFLALSAWDTLGTLWAMLLGAASSALPYTMTRRQSGPTEGLS